jgi:hypothetical protein
MEEPTHHFTLQEAQALVSWLQGTFDAIDPLMNELVRARARVHSLMARIQSNGGASAEEDMEKATRALHETQSRIDRHAYTIVERGIIVRSVERGLVDFPSMRDRRTIHLCWLSGESSITHWHETDAGFAGRQPL